ncbi:hypothetical protein COU91_02225 [Candidatus Saccharibacteria bacterium CG10_big_fil_rev_8_21_14_0_10_47_8]|nr:MAG: hypothetical protein COU91_02225 [Candidatus Saccharibacteria bacterium CG10_big_fil_rev_8_21_14_0_10_47_8]
MSHESQKGFHLTIIALVILILGVVGLVGYKVISNQPATSSSIISGSGSVESKAVKAGKSLSANKCVGTGDATFTSLPMKPEDFSILIPYGLVVGGHVTPIDHQYFAPKDHNSARDSYPVYAMADATIVDIQPRANDRGTEYRFVFAHSCTFLYYYDLVTSLSGKVKQAYDKNNREINLPIKAGEQVGAIGGQTLDFAVWRTNGTLKGFIVPSHYDGEGWKIYTTNPFPYYTPELRAIVEARNPRVAEPVEGKIDYDIDGKLVGNWFVRASGGYIGGQKQEYWKTHLSIAPDLYDPSHFTISLGDYGGQAEQFEDLDNAPDPATVGVDAGLVKYDLTSWNYLTSTGANWNRDSVAKGLTAKSSGQGVGCLLAQLTSTRILKAEPFPGKSCSMITGFADSVKFYER